MSSNGYYIKPKQLAAAIGVSESSLKRWSDKGILPTVKTAGGHRRLPVWGVIEFLRFTRHPVLHPELLTFPVPSGAPESLELGKVAASFQRLLIAGHADEAYAIAVRAHISGHSPADLCDDLFRPVMEQIGRNWESGHTAVYEEHLATQTLKRVLGQLRGLLRPTEDTCPLALGAAPSGDPYSLPSQMIEWVMSGLGWRAISFGPDTPLSTLAKAVTTYRPQVVWLSISAPIMQLEPFVAEYHRFQEAATRAGSSIIIGGRNATDELRGRLSFASHGNRIRHLTAFVECLTRRNGSSSGDETRRPPPAR